LANPLPGLMDERLLELVAVCLPGSRNAATTQTASFKVFLLTVEKIGRKFLSMLR
jgi:hypothetical protein